MKAFVNPLPSSLTMSFLPSPIPGIPDQLPFFCKSIIRKVEKKELWRNKRKTLNFIMGAQHLHLSFHLGSRVEQSQASSLLY
jgi:hypothetical protein